MLATRTVSGSCQIRYTELKLHPVVPFLENEGKHEVQMGVTLIIPLASWFFAESTLFSYAHLPSLLIGI
jgi:hypothetical protein